MVLPSAHYQGFGSDTGSSPPESRLPGSIFAEGWLDLREHADHAARATALHEPLVRWLQQRSGLLGPLQMVDLGCGHGSNPRYLTSRLPGPQQWLLMDHDGELLERTSQRCSQLVDNSQRAISVTRRQADLKQPAALDIERADLISASALIDLVSAHWLEQLVECCHQHEAAALLTLSIDGVIELFDDQQRRYEEPPDRRLLEALHQHQQRDKGFGKALGSQGPDRAKILFEACSYQVTTARSDWQLKADSPADRALLRQLLGGWRTALQEQLPKEETMIEDWYLRHIQRLDDEQLSARIGHIDLLALPPESGI
ncbi:hypothetical protein [Kushneria phosphatilytica]|uniref:Uncharacterized protein n=1 Tax=Kushneria phosphatilytica TaxID=657387 RepID=A0A1S1NX69_9GAMM|nr:hypothetical protein [Kushneria phosphatilytica]OHV12160.1 hypothetical protein BH688_05780 [Kushneria phosphatilytica]QEL11353.1 hypothetical protein FY550_09520 [Kushneria phosphatilytica]